jgi:peptide-methionine (R)-S-oxide reductase
MGGRVREKVMRSDEEWRSLLSPEQFRVLRRAGTEPAFSGVYTDLEDEGSYVCAGCEARLFSSAAKFHSGCGWPSFWQPVESDAVTEHPDTTFGMTRTEIRCAVCDGHLGHVFNDGPPPTGLRYCINSVSLKFVPDSPDASGG